MTDQTPTLLALDFDGVICDGLIEYFQTAWQAYCSLWPSTGSTPPDGLAEQFYRLRPVVETGWEMPVLLRSLLSGTTETEILADWGAIAPQVVKEKGLTPIAIAAEVDRIRDEWIAQDLPQWLAQHRLYPGVGDRLRSILASSVEVTIVTTKEQRFVRQLLADAGIDLPAHQIFGKEVRRPKADTLRLLIQARVQGKDPATAAPIALWFIEDRLKTLQSIQTQPDLAEVKLFLADWGYNTAADRNMAHDDPTIGLLSLAEFAQDFSHWGMAQ